MHPGGCSLRKTAARASPKTPTRTFGTLPSPNWPAFSERWTRTLFRRWVVRFTPLADLADRAETFLQDADHAARLGVDCRAQTAALAERVPHIRRAHERVLALELPLLPAHGDAHPMNALTGCGVVWFDWSEACVAHPLLDSSWFWRGSRTLDGGTLPLRQTHPDATTDVMANVPASVGLT